MSPRAGFTLTEVLISLMIFSIVSIAMVGALLMGSRLFREGEMARAANDEAMSILALLDRDIEAAIPYAQYGDFYAVLPSPDHADCAVAWVIANPDPATAREQPTVCVLWGRDHNGDLRRLVLDSFADLDHQNPGADNLRDDDPRDLLTPGAGNPGGAMVTDRCRYFGVFLAGTGAQGAFQEEVLTHPVDSWWRECRAADGTVDPTPPLRDPTPLDGTYHSNPQHSPVAQRYPSAIRFYLLMEGRGGTAKRGVVVADSGSVLRVAGLQGLPTTPGSVLVIDHASGAQANPGYEIVGYHGFVNGVLQINQTADHGPLGSSDGRGVFRSVRPAGGTHGAGHTVRACRAFSLVKALPH